MPSSTPARDIEYRQHLEVETPEHVVLDLEIAGFASRLLAALLDSLIVTGLGVAWFVLLAVLLGFGLLGEPWFGALVLLGGFALWNGYFILFEGLRRGQTPGKRRLGIRVVRDTGHAVTLGDAVVRNLLRVADFLPPPYLGGLLLMAFHRRGKRLGDLAAGTVVVRDRPAEWLRPAAAAPAPSALAAPELSDAEFRLLGRFLDRAAQLDAPARDRLAGSLAVRFGARLGHRSGAPLELLVELHARELASRRGLGGARGGRAERLAARQEARWAEFSALAERAARRGLDGFRAEELPDFAARYREVAADLARARTYGAEPAALARLERLVAAGHNALYRDERKTWGATWRLVARGFPAAVLEARRVVLIAFLVFALPAAGGYRLLRERPELAGELIPEVMLRRAAAGHARLAEGRRYVEVDWSARPATASFIITNNIRVAVACFAGGIFLGVGSLVLLAYNGLAIGTFFGHFANQGLLGYLLEFVLGHGVLELSAIWIAGAAGFLLGRSVIAPGDLSRADALVVNGRLAARLVGMAVVLLAIAGLIEGFLSVSGAGLGLRAAVSGGSALLLLLYVRNGSVREGRLKRPGASSASEWPAPRFPAGWPGSPGRADPG